MSVFYPPPVHDPSRYFAEAHHQLVWHKPDSTRVSEYLKKSRGDLFEVAGPIFREQEHKAGQGPLPTYVRSVAGTATANGSNRTGPELALGARSRPAPNHLK